MSFQNHPAIALYYSELAALHASGLTNETQTRPAFREMLRALAKEGGYRFEEEVPVGAKGTRKVDGAVQDLYSPLGYWEAKDAKDDLDKEIARKKLAGYPTSNTIFEDTRQAVLYQNAVEVQRYNLKKAEEVAALLEKFFGYTEADREGFNDAVRLFIQKIPELARALALKISDEKNNAKFKTAFDSFFVVCQNALNPGIKESAVEEMLVQHLLTERLFKKVFDNEKWFAGNIIAGELENVIEALSSRSWNRADFLKSLDPFFKSIEDRARTLPDYGAKQDFLNTVYEQFLKVYSPDTADTMGIVYTPQPIVDWMCASVERVLELEFGQKLSDEGVHILDPCTGTGNFLVNIMRRIPADRLPAKYTGKKNELGEFVPELWANELMLLPYYVASGNIEHEFFDLCGLHAPFKGLCFQDTLDLSHSAQASMFAQQNTERIEAQKAAPLTVIIGNPPYNVGQKNENDNNKNRSYKGKKNEPGVDDLIKATYAKESRATLQNKLYDPYVRFFKWAEDRLKGRNGVVCLVTNNSFVDQHAFDGMRATLGTSFNHIWHLDLHGNVRRNPKLSGTTHNVFGIQVGVGITILVKNSASSERFIRYFRLPEFARKSEKLDWLAEVKDVDGVDWQTLSPNSKNAWLTKGLEAAFDAFVPMGSKEAKAAKDEEAIFHSYSLGVVTSRDSWVYNFDHHQLSSNIKRFIDIYNVEVDKSKNTPPNLVDWDSFFHSKSTQIKWTDRLKIALKNGRKLAFDESKVRPALYRPFAKQWMYFDELLNQRQYVQPRIFPKVTSENLVIMVPSVGSRQQFSCLMTDRISDLNFTSADPYQCFPLYTFSADGSERFDNITSHALGLARAAYGESVSREDIFYATYALLHAPDYRAKYGENLKRELPRLPLGQDAVSPSDWHKLVSVGRKLGDLHVGYESVEPFDFTSHNTTPEGKPYSFRVEKMRWNPDKTRLLVNDSIQLSGFTPEMFSYKLGNRSALDWVVESFRVKEDARSGLVSDPNRSDEPRFILDLIGRVATVSLETQKLVGQLPPLFAATE